MATVAPAKPTAQAEPIARPELVQVKEALVVRPADDLVSSAQRLPTTTPEATPESASQVEPVSTVGDTANLPRKGFFRNESDDLFHRDSTEAAATPLPSVAVAQPGAVKTAPVSTNPGTVSRMAGATTESASIAARYAYLAPAKPAPGNRVEAERLFAEALTDQHDRRLRESRGGYRAATHADPGFFEAQSNLGLAAYDAGDLSLSLSAYETALAITPTSFNARFNFALALKKANYLIDAAAELERLLLINTAESPAHLAAAHLMLANLYSEQFHQPPAARAHYAKVLELDPQNSQGTAIRYWLRDNP